jgi:GntR family transcriptional regulator, vanillate catabolism transcriptional regulator
VLDKGFLVPDDVGAWSRLNDRFHSAVIEAAGSPVIADTIARNNHLPFASAGSITLDTGALDKEYAKLRFAHDQHCLIVDALERRESARAEMLMREHAYVGLRYGRLFGLADGAG